jgi:hypothetical protein
VPGISFAGNAGRHGSFSMVDPMPTLLDPLVREPFRALGCTR